MKSALKNHWLGGIRYPKAGGFNQAGARINITTESNKKYTKSLINGDSFRSIHSNKVIFCLGDEDIVKQIEVIWPNGEKEIIRNPKIDNYYVFPVSFESANKLSLHLK